MEEKVIPIDQLLQEALEEYKSFFKTTPVAIGCAPGRVNLLGEHTDYNDGFVFPMALPFVTLVVGAPNNYNKCIVHTMSSSVGEEVEVYFPPPTSGRLEPGQPSWANYVKGIVAKFPAQVPSFDALIKTSVPIGGGLSSSAALEVAFYTFLEGITGKCTKNPKEKALTCQMAEHEFAGVPCGIMDQFISVMGKENHALLLDCREQEATLVPLKDPNLVVLITDSGVKHDLGISEYPLRRAQCQEAAMIMDLDSLRDASISDLEAQRNNPRMTSVIFKRARHVIKEISRTFQGAKALQSRDYNSFGLLMCHSHYSLRDDYEVSCPELDKIVDISISCDGVYGCRMTGAGFGGCTVALVKQEAVNNVMEAILAKFPNKPPKFYIVRASEGARMIIPKI